MKKLSSRSLEVIEQSINNHKDKRGPIKLMLHDIQQGLGYIPLEAMKMISDATGESVANIYGVVTFYTQFTTEPKGKYVINVCMGTACYVNNAQKVLDNVLALTGAPVNGTSEDLLFSVDATRCLGACGLATVATVNGKVYGVADQTGDVETLIKEIIAEERVSVA